MNGWLEGMKDGCVDGFYTVVRRRATAVCVTRTYLSNRLSLPSFLRLLSSSFYLLPFSFILHSSFFNKVKLFRWWLTTLGPCYPEQCSRVVLVNVPWAFHAGWRVARMWLPARTTGKISILRGPASWPADELEAWVDVARLRRCVDHGGDGGGDQQQQQQQQQQLKQHLFVGSEGERMMDAAGAASAACGKGGAGEGAGAGAGAGEGVVEGVGKEGGEGKCLDGGDG